LSIDAQKITSEQEFSRIAGLALGAGMQGFMDEQFIKTMNDALADSSSIEALIVTGPDGEYGFEKQKGRAITWINNSPRFINRLSFSSENYYRPLPIHDLRNANIKAVAGAFNFIEISKILKETLFLILIGFIISFFTLLLFLLLNKPDEKIVTSPVYVQEENVVQNRQEPEKETVIISAAPAMTEKGPKGLYSTRSNIGWEEYTNDRLDSELHRCSSTEHDLTLIIMEFTDMTNDSMFKQAAQEAAAFFSSRDLLFEYGKYGISVILPGTDLETGITKSEKFQQRIIGKFPPASNSRANLCVGLSSRSGRLLNSERLLFECKQALEKAKSDPKSSIIAFKSDPEKYRAFIRNQA
jgi:GGDEF domain-containing protein